MTRAHKKTGLREPADRTAQVRAVDGEHLELIAFDVPDPARSIHGLAVSRHNKRISEFSQPGFAFRELTDWAQRDPVEITVRTPACNRGKQESSDWPGKDTGGACVEDDPQLHEQSAPGYGCCFIRHGLLS
jgi:hypothetical protein